MWTRRESKITCLDLLNLMADEDTKLLGALVHLVMHNNLLTRLHIYSALQASRDFDVSYAKLKRVITGVKQHGGSYYERLCREQEGG